MAVRKAIVQQQGVAELHQAVALIGVKCVEPAIACFQIDDLLSAVITARQSLHCLTVRRSGGAELGQRLAGLLRQQQLEGVIVDAAGHDVGTIVGDDGDRPQPCFRQHRDLGGVAVHHPAVAYLAVFVEFRHIEAQAETILLSRIGILDLPHLFQRLRLQ